jgi:uncharacterized membrane protein YdbT with pleckstrin-like domain
MVLHSSSIVASVVVLLLLLLLLLWILLTKHRLFRSCTVPLVGYNESGVVVGRWCCSCSCD